MARVAAYARNNKRVIVTGRKKVITLIFVLLCIAVALLIYRMGIYIGKRMAEQEFEFMRQEMELESKKDKE